MDYLKVKVSFTTYILEARGFTKLGRLSEEDSALSSWCISLAAKLAVSERMDLVTDMAIDTNRAMRPNIFGMIFPFLYFY